MKLMASPVSSAWTNHKREKSKTYQGNRAIDLLYSLSHCGYVSLVVIYIRFLPFVYVPPEA